MSTPSVHDVRVVDDHRVDVDITDGPTLTKNYGKRPYRVEMATVIYRRRDAAPWEVSNVTLTGPFVKKDGNCGLDMTSDHMWRDDWQQMDWLSDLVERYQPAADQ